MVEGGIFVTLSSCWQPSSPRQEGDNYCRSRGFMKEKRSPITVIVPLQDSSLQSNFCPLNGFKMPPLFYIWKKE